MQEEILAYLQQHRNHYLADLRALTAIDSGTLYKEGVDAVQSWLHARLAALGFNVERLAQERLGDNLLATRHGEGGKRVLLLGHADTVFPVGVAAARPMSIDGNVIHGPGVCDMKGGLLTGLYAIRALDAVGFRKYGALQFLIVSDEEVHDRGSLPLIRQSARESDVAFTLEAARANGDIVTARKTAVWCTVRVQGKAAHAGVEPEKGRSAIVALMRHLLEIDQLNGMRVGVTVNIGRIDGGTQPNVVAEEARAEIDLRAWRNADIPDLLDAIRTQLEQPVLAGATATLDVKLEGAMPAMERTPAVAALETLTQQLAAGLGFTVKGASTGGASDASFVAAEGVPVLDGLGLDHSPDEYIELDSIAPRTALLALLVAESGGR
jgi:glutamate carboxypeptidase